MRRSSDFGAAVRRGRRAGTRTVVVHALVDEPPSASSAIVGFVVSKAVGGAVVRNRVKRRLRALVRPLVPHLVPGVRVVVRAQPAAATATSAMMGRDLAFALRRAAALTTVVTGTEVGP